MSGATFVVRGGVVEITTRYNASPSNWRSGSLPRVPPPEVSFAFEKRPLQESLQEIADATGVNIVLNAHSEDEGKTPVRASLRGAAVDTAVTILANMAGLQVVVLDNVLCVATKESAKRLQKEQERGLRATALAAEASAALAFPGSPPPVQPESERLIKERDEQIRRLKEKLRRRQQSDIMPKSDK